MKEIRKSNLTLFRYLCMYLTELNLNKFNVNVPKLNLFECTGMGGGAGGNRYIGWNEDDENAEFTFSPLVRGDEGDEGDDDDGGNALAVAMQAVARGDIVLVPTVLEDMSTGDDGRVDAHHLTIHI